jgi:hypothetical protein
MHVVPTCQGALTSIDNMIHSGKTTKADPLRCLGGPHQVGIDTGGFSGMKGPGTAAVIARG